MQHHFSTQTFRVHLSQVSLPRKIIYSYSAGRKLCVPHSSGTPECVRRQKEEWNPTVKLCLGPQLLLPSTVQKEEDNYHHRPVIWWPTGNSFVV